MLNGIACKRNWGGQAGKLHKLHTRHVDRTCLNCFSHSSRAQLCLQPTPRLLSSPFQFPPISMAWTISTLPTKLHRAKCMNGWTQLNWIARLVDCPAAGLERRLRAIRKRGTFPNVLIMTTNTEIISPPFIDRVGSQKDWHSLYGRDPDIFTYGTSSKRVLFFVFGVVFSPFGGSDGHCVAPSALSF